jgi:hypothetical protein
VILISNSFLEVLEGSTVASTEIYGTDKKAYINIGSGSVFNLKWDTPVLSNDTIGRYDLVIKCYDPVLNTYYDIFDKNIGLVNKFCVDSSMLPALPEQYMLSIYVVAHSKSGGVVTSNTVNPYVCKGSGTYVKVQPEGYAEPIMKRAIAFVNVRQITADSAVGEQLSQFLVDSEGTILFSSDGDVLATNGSDYIIYEDVAVIKNSAGKKVPILDKSGNEVPLAMTRLLTSNDWQLVQSGYVKAPDDTWQNTDIKFEVLVVKNKDNKFEPLEIRTTEGNYELLYIL